MPIEVQIEKAHGKHIPVEETQRLARTYANEQIVKQKADFRRLGVLGDWDHPYTTMAFKSEADEIRTLGKLLEKGFIYRGLKPVNWCFDCGSALAEAEVEYEDRDDIAVDVAFPIDAADRDRLAAAFSLHALPAGPVLAIIWTTTPWTLPANQALNLNPEFSYALVATERGHLVLAQDLVETCMARFKLSGRIVATAKGAALELIRFRHPLYDRASPVYLGSYVTLEQGTGIVHSSPAYGVEDFQSCPPLRDERRRDPESGGRGRPLRREPALLRWRKDLEANPQIVAKLRERGALFSAEKFTHSYMHCWRQPDAGNLPRDNAMVRRHGRRARWNGRKPERTLRETALAGIEATQFFPAWGKARLYGMIASRPDWTLSRQRQWGVPMPFFTHKETGALHPRTLALLEEVAQRVEKGGIEAWQTLDVRELSRRRSFRLRQDQGHARRVVRFGLDAPDRDGRPGQRTHGSGSHHRDTRFPADLYLEGSDQHRGWFHSSLLVSCMLNGRPPYKALLTHGFAVDGEGKKMSKSKGNGVEPQKVSNTLGAEILRLWVASTDYSGELFISDEILKRVVEGYRRIRNTLRFLLANTSDFDPATDAVPLGELLEIDRYAVAAARALADAAEGDYARYEFHVVVQRLQTFCSEDLGGFYLDVLKDRLYTTGKGSVARRSAQTALALIRDALLLLTAPVLSFTAEEAWRIVRPGDASIFCRTWGGYHAAPARGRASAGEVVAYPRGACRRAEGTRNAASGREDRIVAAGRRGDRGVGRRLRRLGEPSRRSSLRADHIGSDRRPRRSPHHRGYPQHACENASVAGTTRPEVGSDSKHPTLCGRCLANLFGAGEPRAFA